MTKNGVGCVHVKVNMGTDKGKVVGSSPLDRMHWWDGIVISESSQAHWTRQ